jgi:hypothetical protein
VGAARSILLRPIWAQSAGCKRSSRRQSRAAFHLIEGVRSVGNSLERASPDRKGGEDVKKALVERSVRLININ